MERWRLKVQPKNHIHILGSAKECEGLNPHTPKWVLTLEIGILRDFRILKEQFKGQNSLDWKVFYTIGIFLKCKYLNWACMIHLNIYNISYGQKKDHESNVNFDFWALKIKNHPELCAYKWHAKYCWKVLNKGYNFVLDFASIESFHKKLWVSKIVKVLILKISRFSTWESWEQWHLGVALVASHK
jgi:hypothetical protein